MSARARRRITLATFAVVAVSLALVQTILVVRGLPHLSRVVTPVEVPGVADPRFEQMLELFTGTHIEAGNAVQPLLNGNETFPLLWRDLASARRTITIEMYYAQPGKVSDTLAAILSARARAGVRVLLLLDAFGAEEMRRKDWMRQLRANGVEVELLRPLQWYTIHNATNRSHVRAIVIDGRVGYTGGFGFADYWLGDGRTKGAWRESNVRFEGPAVRELQAAFAAGWDEATGELISGEQFFPTEIGKPLPGNARAGLLFTTPTAGSTSAERFLALAIRSAQKRLYITNPYFVPDESFQRLLMDAAARHVDVRILTAGRRTDVKIPLYAARYLYEDLINSGVRVYEYAPTMMHAKSIVIDDAWSTIGSMNFDSHSLAFNDESNLVVVDSTLGRTMDSVFFEDLRFAREITPQQLAQRSWLDRVLERASTMLSGML